MDINLTELRVTGAVGIVAVGVLTTVGAFAVSFLVAGVVRAGLTIAGWVSGIHAHPARAPGGDARTGGSHGLEAGSRLADGAEHVLFARQAWWRLRC